MDGVVPPLTMHKGEAAQWRSLTRRDPITATTRPVKSRRSRRGDELARQEDAAGDDPEKVKPFQNTGLGRAYEPKSDGPAWEVLVGAGVKVIGTAVSRLRERSTLRLPSTFKAMASTGSELDMP